MKLTIWHDRHGNIAALVAYPPDAPPVHMATKLGERMTEIEVPELNVELGHQKIQQYLADLAANHRVEVESKAKLARK